VRKLYCPRVGWEMGDNSGSPAEAGSRMMGSDRVMEGIDEGSEDEGMDERRTHVRTCLDISMHGVEE